MKIVWLTDMDVRGSGYKNLSVPLCTKLTESGHEIKVLGINYKGEEHNFPFSIIPCGVLTHAQAMVANLRNMWDFDVMIVALDIPLQEKIMSLFPERDFEYWGIFPVEAPPLTRSWAATLNLMDRQFIISEFGTEAAHKVGVSLAEFLPVGIDAEAWKVPTPKERQMLRTSYGYSDDDFVVLTVADNQERKFLSRTAQIIQAFKDTHHVSVRWILVTRQNSPVGWKLGDLAADLNLVNEFMPLERGMSFKELWSLYAMSDCFLLTSKAEGIGMPVIEAMSVGIPVVATRCTGMEESMTKGGGFPIEPEEHEVRFIDPFGNGNRYFASVKSGVQQLLNVYEKQGTKEQCSKARGYVETLDWDSSAQILNIALGEIDG